MFVAWATCKAASSPSLDESGIVVSYSIEQQTLIHGGPVQVAVHVANDSTAPLELNLGRARKGSFSLVLTRPDGASGTLPPLPRREGLFDPGRVTLAPGERLTSKFALNEWTTLDRQGTYTLGVQLTAPIVTHAGTQISIPRRSLTFELAPRNEALLLQACEELTRQIESSRSAREAKEAASALGYVADPVAVPYLERALRSGKYVESEIMDGLVRLGSPDAVAVLERVLQEGTESVSSSGPAENSRVNGAVQSLPRIQAQTRDEGLRRELEAVLAQQGGKTR